MCSTKDLGDRFLNRYNSVSFSPSWEEEEQDSPRMGVKPRTRHTPRNQTTSPHMGVKHLGALFAVLATCLVAVAGAKKNDAHLHHTPMGRLAAKLGISLDLHATSHRRLGGAHHGSGGDGDCNSKDEVQKIEPYRAKWFERNFFKRSGDSSKVGFSQEWGGWMIEFAVGGAACLSGTLMLIFWAELPGVMNWISIPTEDIVGIPGATEIDAFSVLTDTRETLIEEITKATLGEDGAELLASDSDINLNAYVNQVPAEGYAAFMTICLCLLVFGLLVLQGYKWGWCGFGAFMALCMGVCVYAGYNHEMTQIAAELQRVIDGAAEGTTLKQLVEGSDQLLQSNEIVNDLDTWSNLTEWHIAAIVIGSTLVFFIALGFWRKYKRHEKGFCGHA